MQFPRDRAKIGGTVCRKTSFPGISVLYDCASFKALRMIDCNLFYVILESGVYIPKLRSGNRSNYPKNFANLSYGCEMQFLNLSERHKLHVFKKLASI
jgi:hypothetical protein